MTWVRRLGYFGCLCSLVLLCGACLLPEVGAELEPQAPNEPVSQGPASGANAAARSERMVDAGSTATPSAESEWALPQQDAGQVPSAPMMMARAGGQECSADAECSTGYCVTGVCCSVRECDSCEVCSGAGASCVPLGDGVGSSECTGSHACSRGKCSSVDIDNTTALSGSPLRVGAQSAVAQTFAVPSRGRLVELRLGWASTRSSSGDVCIQSTAALYDVAADGTPGKTKLATLRIAKNTDVDLYASLMLAQPLAVEAGDRIALVLERGPSPGRCTTLIMFNDAYPEGTAYTKMRLADPEWLPASYQVDVMLKGIVER